MAKCSQPLIVAENLNFMQSDAYIDEERVGR